MMKAKLKNEYPWPTAQLLVGREYVKSEWRAVPEELEDDARGLAMLELQEDEAIPEIELELMPEIEPVGGELLATEAAIQLANEANLVLADVPGTGANGKILKSDVAALIEAFAAGETHG